jgi:hypothetical protein
VIDWRELREVLLVAVFASVVSTVVVLGFAYGVGWLR